MIEARVSIIIKKNFDNITHMLHIVSDHPKTLHPLLR